MECESSSPKTIRHQNVTSARRDFAVKFYFAQLAIKDVTRSGDEKLEKMKFAWILSLA